ncbi:2Fe-2S iron-sulfur cluster binding domain-containing protein [Pedobacter sp. HMF7647]|uniref:2Fe-2S iron-sulfur cluster binding domain-containing protein n=1 Tax=Hufsiella arboris TaxID=2695275 RepID=A0A7K1Y7R8_9SPHI|nr:adenylate/guanylate cyclase domain-containing protein [Hufsiella arboris]MXV50623.1 2Fe-2S iron-sulfur cluster binding domain-containing protein [Hufsiella arboris]
MGGERFFELTITGEEKLSIPQGKSILETALSAKIPFYHDCGGKAKCTTCRVIVLDGEEWLNKPNSREQAAKEKMRLPDTVRLACQTQVLGGEVTVQRLIRDKDDIYYYVGSKAYSDKLTIGEERELTLFFLDIKDFTSLIESNLPFDVMHILRRLFNIFKKAIEKHEGKILETAGDGLYAVFGLNNDSIAETAQNAVDAAHAINIELDLCNEQYFSLFGKSFEVGIGIHAGNTVVGSIGLGINNNLTVMGFAVNVASRLQSLTRSLNNNIIISRTILKRLTSLPEQKIAKKIKLKGVSKFMTAYLIGREFNAAQKND